MNYLEQDFEEHIEEQLVQSGYISSDPSIYDKSLCLIPTQLIGFIQETQPKILEKLELQYSSETENKLIKRISYEIENRGVIDVLRNGVKTRGCEFKLVYFQPKSGLNPEHKDLYKQNRFTVIRQLKYSMKNENSIDMGIFINGIPIVMMELKNTLTGQNHINGEKQWKYDRDPKEPLFRFKRNLVYFSVGNEKVSMTTRLTGSKTRFLPYNKDIINPVNPNGHMTHYLWEDILQPNSMLDLIENFVHISEEKEKVYDPKVGKVVDKKTDVLIFPRFHQLKIIRKLKKSVIEEGVGNNYLIQHTTGSGKSLSIGWLSHLLSSLYRNPNETERMFDSIIVVTDRRLLDKQIRDTIKQLEQTKGVVNPVDIDSQQLKEFLELGKTIIVTTVQKFPVISESISKLKSKNFGVIIDEVHSSQSGETSKHLKMSLSKSVLDEYQEGEDTDDLTDYERKILTQIISRGKQDHISYFGFSGTPKNKTLEIFGRKNENGQFESFDTYSMEQSIYEGFTLDVLQNYTTYERYFKLNKKIEEDKELPSSRVKKMLVSWVDIQPHTITEKSKIILDHFVNKTSKRMSGKSRGMLVTRSRLHCVKFKLELDKQMKEMGLPYGCLVGFSGTVYDKDTHKEYSETSMNKFSEKYTQDNFKDPQYRILIVCDKFQTGFDEPLLHTMYVDKRLQGLQCVQTLSRLNRSMRGKTDTFVMDFVNKPKIIQDSFQPYYQGTILVEETDPDKLYTIEQQIKDFNLFQDEIVNELIEKFYDDRIPDEELQPILDTVVNDWRELEEDEREEFRHQIQSFVRLYGYISQIITFKDINLEKLYIFLRFLNKKLPKRSRERLTDVFSYVDLEYFRIEKKYTTKIKLESEYGELEPMSTEVGGISDDPLDFLSHIVQVLNENFGSDITEDDKINLEKIRFGLKENKELRKVHTSDNTESNKRFVFNKEFDRLLQGLVDDSLDFYKKLTEPKRNEYLKRVLFEDYSGKIVRNAR
ncbi:MAG: type I restriction endonuclease subunit R [Candidatus Marinimicrobia bacterium]|nr:type I restriction endonuclease subunit R [Candidatus Neomarinimicrobiota bacterium]